MEFSVENVMARRETLLKIITKFKKDGKPVSRFSLQPALKEAGFDVSVATIYRDMTVINRENTWVRDLVESNYSAYQEHIYDTLNMIEKEAWEMYEKRPTITKTAHKEISKNGQVTIIEETNTEEVANMTIWLLNMILKVQEIKIKHTHGDNIYISAALLGEEIKKLKEKYYEFEEKAKKYDSENDKTPIVNVLELVKMKNMLPDSEDSS